MSKITRVNNGDYELSIKNGDIILSSNNVTFDTAVIDSTSTDLSLFSTPNMITVGPLNVSGSKFVIQNSILELDGDLTSSKYWLNVFNEPESIDAFTNASNILVGNSTTSVNIPGSSIVNNLTIGNTFIANNGGTFNNDVYVDGDIVVSGNIDLNNVDLRVNSVFINTGLIESDSIISIQTTDGVDFQDHIGVLIPRGTTSQRTNNSSGLIRYNTTDNLFEFNQQNEWVNFSHSNNQVSSKSLEFNTIGVSPVTIDEFDSLLYRSCKYVLQMESNPNYHSCEISIIHNSTDVNVVQYLDNVIGDICGTFDAIFNGDNIELVFTPLFNNVSLTIVKTLIGKVN